MQLSFFFFLFCIFMALALPFFFFSIFFFHGSLSILRRVYAAAITIGGAFKNELQRSFFPPVLCLVLFLCLFRFFFFIITSVVLFSANTRKDNHNVGRTAWSWRVRTVNNYRRKKVMLPFQAVEPDSEKKKKKLTPSHKSQRFFFFLFFYNQKIKFVNDIII